MAQTIVNQHGRVLDDLDLVKMQVSVRDVVPDDHSYTIYTSDCVAVCGRVLNDSKGHERLTLRNWKAVEA